MLTPDVMFVAGEPTLTTISFRLEADGVALEGNETFVLSYTGVGNGLEFAGSVIDALETTIIDVDGKSNIASFNWRLWATKINA